MQRKLLLLMLLAVNSTLLFADASLLPLRPGNSWTLRQRGGGQTITIKVGVPAYIGERIYYRLTGYVSAPLWTRFNEYGNLVYLDEETSQEALLTGFEAAAGGWHNAPYRPCEQESQPQARQLTPVETKAVAASTVSLRYRSFRCADAGITEEQYAPNLGLVQRTVTTIAGPRVFELVDARIGGALIRTDPGASFSVTLDSADTHQAVLELHVNTPDPVTLAFRSSQEFDLQLRNAAGTVVWRWSDGRVFLPVIREQRTVGRRWMALLPDAGQLPAGEYELEAWLTTGIGEENRRFAAAVPLTINE